MATYAVMGGNTVSNVIVADDPQDASNALGAKLIEYTPENPAGIGWTYDEETGRFSQPEPAEPVDAATQKLLDAGLTQEEIQALIAQASNTEDVGYNKDINTPL
jgi:hypothetical protein